MKDQEWKCSTNHPKITPELRKFLKDAFNRLSHLNMKTMQSRSSKAELLEREVLAKLHADFRCGRGKFKPFKGKRYFQAKYEPKKETDAHA